MLIYHEIEHPDSTLLIQETTQYMMNLQTAEDKNITDDLQVTITITDYNQNTIARLDVDLTVTDLEGTNRPSTIEK